MTKTKSAEPEDGAMGFKDKQKALDTLKFLDGRDISYQYHVITSFVSRAKRTLQITKDEEKLANLKEALAVFEDWLADYKANNRGKENLAYLPLETVGGFRSLAKKYGVLDDSFFVAYKKEKGDYKSLRNAEVENGEKTWDIERNKRLKEIICKIKESHIQWYETDVGELRGLPTKEHTQCIMLGYSPDPTKVRKLISQVEEKFGGEEESVMDVDEGEGESRERGTKRVHDSSSSDSSEDEPRKKVSKSSSEQKEERKSGLSFKDKDSALKSIESLEGRDLSYRYHAIAGLVKRAERVISCTKDEAKIENMRQAIEVLENWIADYKANGRAKENLDYLPIDVVRAFKPLADRYEIEDNGFLKAYEEAEGDYKKLRSISVPDSTKTWDIERNRNLRSLLDSVKQEEVVRYVESDGEFSGLPTKEHTRCIMWGFSHDAPTLKKILPTVIERFGRRS